MSEYKISRELFEEVMGIKCLCINIVGRKNNKVIKYSTGYTILNTQSISVNDFFFKCVDYIFDCSYWCDVGYGLEKVGLCTIKHKTILGNIRGFDADSMQQAVFDACEYIRKIKRGVNNDN